MAEEINTPETPKKGLNAVSANHIKLLATMTQNTVGNVDYDWDKIAADSGYKSAIIARQIYSRVCSNIGNGNGKSPEKGDAPVAGGPKTPTKVTKRTTKAGTTSAKKPRGKKAIAAAAAAAAAEAAAADAAVTDAGDPAAANEKQETGKNNEKKDFKPEAAGEAAGETAGDIGDEAVKEAVMSEAVKEAVDETVHEADTVMSGAA